MADEPLLLEHQKKKYQYRFKTGRPGIQIDWNTFEGMCGIQCTEEEIAAVLRCSIDTLKRAVKRQYKKSFAQVFAEKRQYGRASLRRVQWKKAQAGDTTMLIWLGKQHLEQADRQEEIIPQTAHTLRVVYEQDKSGNGEDKAGLIGFGGRNPLAKSALDTESHNREPGQA
jgi:AraC-like DNA-binding protein